MKGVSVRQPWAWAVLQAGCRVISKDWRCDYRGPVLLHAGRALAHRDYVDARIWMRDRGLVDAPGAPDGPEIWDLALGGIVGRARVVGTIRPDGSPVEWLPEVDLIWHQRGSWGIVLADMEALPYRPWRGERMLFDVPDIAPLPRLLPAAR